MLSGRMEALLGLILLVSAAGTQLTPELVFEISENLAEGTLVGLITGPSPPYLIVGTESDLAIDQSNGEIRTKKVLDREVRDFYSFVAIPINGENVRVLVEVKDRNDNAPTFPSPTMSVELPENTPRDVKRTLQPARDKDLGIYNTQRYTISGGNVENAFRLSSHRERDGVLYLDLQVNGFLDRETTPFYNLLIDAYDGGVPPLKGSMTVHVALKDVNDCSPIFNQSRYFATISENATLGTSVLQVYATDTDSGPNGQVTYSINRRQTDKESIFKIDPKNGVISLNRPLDFENKDVHELVVVARDHGLQSLETTVFVSIRVIDVRAHQPQISFVFLTEDGTPKVSVNGLPGEFVARVTVHDPDTKEEYSSVNVSLEGGKGHFGLSTRNDSVYIVLVSKFLERERWAEFSLRITATDLRTPALSATALLRLKVADENDNGPVFSEPFYGFSIEENNVIGAGVGVVVGSDADIGQNGLLTYSLQPPQSHFQIDPNSGRLSASVSLDREKTALYDLRVLARDGGTPQRQAEVKVRVRVLDLNDNAPRLDLLEDPLIVGEEQPEGTEVTRIVATDPDNGQNSTLVFSLVNDGYGGGDAADFTIDSVTGILRTRAVLRHRKNPFYRLAVRVRDSGLPPLQTTHEYRVEVINLEPSTTSPPSTPSNFNFKLSESSRIGELVGTVRGSEEEEGGENGGTTFVIIRGNTHESFAIDKGTGGILVAKQLDYELTPHYLLQVEGTDNSLTNPQCSLVQVSIDLIDENDGVPSFGQDPVFISLPEDTAVGSPVWNFSAVDSDEGLNGLVHYAILRQEPEDKFRVNSVSGALYLQSPLDYEAQKSYIVVLRAADQALDPHKRLNSTITVQINTEDRNNHKPFFVSSPKISVLGSEPVGSLLHTVMAVDLDSAENGRVSYRILSGNEGGHFALDPKNGHLSLAKTLSRAQLAHFSLNISGSDQGSPTHLASQILQVSLEEPRSSPPQFLERRYEAKVQENSLIGTEVLKVTAFGRDQGPNNTLYYVIPEGMAEGKFAIHPSSGSISVAGVIDREATSDFLLTVFAHDGNYISLFDTTVVLIKVLDLNDNPPKITCTDLRIPENQEPGLVHTFTAVDTDTGRNGEVTFSITAGNIDNIFSIDLHSGNLRSRALDRERRIAYHLLITAQDQGLPVQRASCNLTVTVEDDNDNSPVFTKSLYLATISENVAIGTTVLVVEATDSDLGLNAAIHYSINNESHWHFAIDNVTGAVITAGKLDRETQREYSFVVAASDGGLYDSRSSEAQVRILIADVNDEKPKFAVNPVFIKISPEAKLGQNIFQLSAKDEDEGLNGDISYSVEKAETRFRVNPQTGIISPALSLSSEAGKTFQMNVMARDQGIPPLSSTALLVIQVGNVPISNTLRFQESSYEINLPENSVPGTDVVQVTALRNDGRRQKIMYSILGEEENSIFEMVSSTGQIRVRNDSFLDRESQPQHSLTIYARTDGSATPLFTHVVVNVTLTDENDNRPRFMQDSYMAAVREGNSKGTFVTQVKALDSDAGSNSNLLYYIVDGNQDNAFVIEPPFSGIVQTNIVLDREIQDKYRLTIIATDEGSPQMTGTCVLQINVIDTNDNEPFFSLPPNSVVSVSENDPVGTLVTTMVANDVDTSPNLIYSFMEAGNSDGMFSIGKYNGRVTLARPVDYEDVKGYNVQIQVSDSVHTAYTNLSLEVLDFNDSPPVWDKIIYHASIPNDTKSGSQVVQVTATDMDSKENGLIKYSIQVPSEGKSSRNGRWFWIDENTGIVYANGTMSSRYENSFIEITLLATDSGKPRKIAKATLWVEVRPSESDFLQFSKEHYAVDVSKDMKPGTSLLKIEVDYDRQLNSNLHLHYSILDGDEKGYFAIASHTGEILVAKRLTMESTESFKLNVSVNCVTPTKCSSTTMVVINIKDGRRPSFNKTEYRFRVSEEKAVGSSLLKLSTCGTAGQDNVRYDITSGNEGSVFELNSTSGALVLRRALDYEKVSAYRLVARVQYVEAAGRFWDLTVVHVDVEDVNEHTPRFPLSHYLEFVPENEPTGTAVFIARANDLDKGEYGKLNYSILEGGMRDKFEVEPLTGVVTTNTVFDYESLSRYYFTLRATDLGGQSSSVRVQIDIESKDEFSPKFRQETYKFVVPSNAGPGHVVGRVEAKDQDRGPDGYLLYEISEQNGHFKINKTNGAILLKEALTSDLNTSLVILANSGRVGSKFGRTLAEVSIGAPSDELEMAAKSSVADWVVGLLVTFLLLLFLCCTVFVVLHLRQKKQQKKDRPESNYNSAFDTLDYAQSTMLAGNSRPTSLYGPQYSDLAGLGSNERRLVSNTVSELSDNSHSASSGRGSAEDGEEVEDEEIRMINEGSLVQQKLQDLGLTGDEDELSQASAKNTQEYLARLGIRRSLNEDHPSIPTQTGPKEWTPSTRPDALDNIHMFEDEGGGEADGLDISTLIYAQIPEDDGTESGLEESRGPLPPQPSMTGSLSSIVHSEAELAGSYNWDYLQDWGPQYQPLATVFSEIARLKDESCAASEAHYSGLSPRSHGPSTNPSVSGKSSVRAHPAHRFLNHSSGINPRAGPLPPLPILPRSPISHEPNFASPMSPSFSPELSFCSSPPGILEPNMGNVIRTTQYHPNYSSSESSEMRI